MDWSEIIVAVIGTGAVVKLMDYFLGGRRQANLDIMQKELERMDTRVGKLERQQERYEARDCIFSSATSRAHKCQLPDEECPVLNYLEGHPLPEKNV